MNSNILNLVSEESFTQKMDELADAILASNENIADELAEETAEAVWPLLEPKVDEKIAEISLPVDINKMVLTVDEDGTSAIVQDGKDITDSVKSLVTPDDYVTKDDLDAVEKKYHL